MTQQIGQITVDLDARVAKFNANIEAARASLERSSGRMQKSLDSLDKSFGLVGRAAAGFLGALSVGALVGLGARALQTGASLVDMARALGITTDALQVYQFAAAEVGASQSDLDASLKTLSKNLGEAARGSDEAIKSFQALGVKVLDVDGKLKPLERIVAEVADGLAATEDPARRNAAAIKLMGEQALRLVPALSAGAAGLAAVRDRAEEAGAVTGGKMLEDMKRAEVQLGLLQKRFEAIALVLAGQLAPYLEKFADLLERRLNATPQSEAIAALEARIAALGAEARGVVDDLDYFRAQFQDDPTPEMAKRIEGLKARFDELALSIQLVAQERDRLKGTGSFAPAVVPLPLAKPGSQGQDPRSERQIAAEKQITESLKKKIDTLQAEAAAYGKSDAARAMLLATAEAEAAARAAGLGPLTAGQKALIGEVGALVAAAEARERALEGVRAYAAAVAESVDLELQAETERARIAGQVAKLAEAHRQDTAELRERIEAARESRIEFDALTGTFRVYDRELRIVTETQRLMRENLGLSAAEARRLAEETVDLTRELEKSDAELKQRAENLTEAAQDATRVISSGLEDALLGSAKASDVLGGALDDLRRIILRTFVTKPLENWFQALVQGFTDTGNAARGSGLFGGGGKGGGGGLLGGLFDSIGGLFGGGASAGSLAGTALVPGPSGGLFPALDSGGSFKVGPTAGIDQAFFGAYVSAGERIHVVPEGEGTGGGPRQVINITMTHPTEDAVKQLWRQVGRLRAEMPGIAVNAVVDHRRRGRGGLAESFG